MGGYVYTLVNRSFRGMVKIGHTTREPVERAKELSVSTGIPTPFEVLASFWTEDPAAAERDLHRLFFKKRVNKGREFFRVKPEEVLAVFEDRSGRAYRAPSGFAPLQEPIGTGKTRAAASGPMDAVALARAARLELERGPKPRPERDYAGVRAARRELDDELKKR